MMTTTTMSHHQDPPKTAGVSRPAGPPPAWVAPPERVVFEFKMPKPQPFRLDPSTTALVIVDMQNCFIHSDRFPYAARSPRGKPLSGDNMARLASPLEPNVKLLGKAREAGIPVIFIQSVRKDDNIEVTRFGKRPYLLEGTPDVMIVPELAPLPGESVVKKWGHDPWARTELEAVLRERNIVPDNWTVVVTGISAATCHQACVLGFSNRHYMAIIPMDCTAGPTLEDEARTFAGFANMSYNHNVAFSLADRISFEPGAPPAEKQL